MNKNILWGIIGVCLIIILAALFINRVNPFILGVNKDSTKEDVKVGAALALTNYCSTWGEDELKSIELAVEEANLGGGINGRKIELVSEDTACSPKGTVNAVAKLIDANGVEIIIGPTWGDSFQGGFILSNNKKIPAVSPSAAMEALISNNAPIDYVFSTYFPQDDEISAIQDYMNKTGKKNIVIMHDQDPFGLVVMDIFKKGASSHDIKIIKEYIIPSNSSDFRTKIVELKALNPDGIYASFLEPKKKGAFLKQAHELGLNAQLFSSTDIQDNDILAQFGPVLDGVIYTYPKPTDRYANFEEKFVSKYSIKPSGPTVTNAYDATNMVIEALREHYKDGDELKTILERISVQGVTTDKIKFNDMHGLEKSEFQIKTIRDGKFIVVE